MFYVIRYYPYAALAAALLLLAWGVFCVVSRRSWPLVKQTAAQYRPFRDKRVMHLLLLAILLANCFMLPLSMAQNAAATISLNYAEASRGLNPNKTRYNQSNILSEEVLAAAIEKGALQNVSVEDLKETLQVAPRVQGAVEDASHYFISTQFTLTYEASPETAHLNGETLLTLVLEEYKRWFLHTYSDNVSVLELDFSQDEKEDYLDICKRLRNQAELISIYAGNMSQREASFQSAQGETFQSVRTQANKVSDVMVERLEAYILENDVSKQTDAYASRLSFQNAFHYFDALRANRKSLNNLAAISMYEDDMARIVLVPTVDVYFQFYMSQTRIGIDDFAKNADTFANEKTGVRARIARNNHILQQFTHETTPDGINEKAEELTAQIEEELMRLARLTRTMVEEFNESHANEYITISVNRLEYQAARVAVTIAAYTLLFAAAAHCTAFSGEMGRVARAVPVQSGASRPPAPAPGQETGEPLRAE